MYTWRSNLFAASGKLNLGGKCKLDCAVCPFKIGKLFMKEFGDLIDVNSIPFLVHSICDNINKIEINYPYIGNCNAAAHPSFDRILVDIFKYAGDRTIILNLDGRFLNEKKIQAIKSIENIIVRFNIYTFSKNLRKKLSIPPLEVAGLKELIEQIESIHFVYAGQEIENELESLAKIDINLLNKNLVFSVLEYTKRDSEVIKELSREAVRSWPETILKGEKLSQNFLYKVRSLSDFSEKMKKKEVDIHLNIWKARQDFESRIDTLNKHLDYLSSSSVVALPGYFYSFALTKLKTKAIKLVNKTIGGNIISPSFIAYNDIIDCFLSDDPYEFYAIPYEIFQYRGMDISGHSMKDYPFNFILF